MAVEDMTRAQLEARLEELRPAAEEHDYLQTLLYLEAEGMIEMEGDRIYPAGEPVELVIP